MNEEIKELASFMKQQKNVKKMKTKEDMLIQKLYFFEAIRDFVVLYARNNIGSRIEVNIEEIAKYLTSDRFMFHVQINYQSKEKMLEMVENDLLNGMPIWKFLKLSKFQYKHLKEEFEEIVEKQKEKKEIYKCDDCIFYKNQETSIGKILSCKPEAYVNLANIKRKSDERREGTDLPVKECEDWLNEEKAIKIIKKSKTRFRLIDY
jgi:hypothetical protein